MGAIRPAVGNVVRRALAVGVLVTLAGVVAGPPSTAAAPRRPKSPPAVIAIIEDGMNLLHTDFTVPGGGDARLPSGVPEFIAVKLPVSGTFEERLEKARAGPLGNLEKETLYYVRGTRVLVYAPRESFTEDAFEDRFHGTGVAGAAVGLKHGTNPDALLVIVVDTGPAAWEWLADQRWIDGVSTSYITVLRGTERCHEAPFIKEITDQGRLVFSAVGNGEQLGEVGSPSGVPEAYQVGGVDSEGRPYLPSIDGYQSTTNRPYETGDRFEFESADSESLEGSMGFGGTSGATPSTAGRATELIEHARSILGSKFTGERAGSLARKEGGRRLPKKGPLADGELSAAELTDVLHHIAQPAEPASPGRYLLEGFGALNGEKVLELGKAILSGTAEMPDRAQEQAAHEQVEAARRAAYFEGRCT